MSLSTLGLFVQTAGVGLLALIFLYVSRENRDRVLQAMGYAWLFLFLSLARKTREHAEVQVLRPVGAALLACTPMVLLLSFNRFSLPMSIFCGALLFVAAGAVILRRGTEAGGLA